MKFCIIITGESFMDAYDNSSVINTDSLDIAYIWNLFGYRILSEEDCRKLFSLQISYTFLLVANEKELSARIDDKSLQRFLIFERAKINQLEKPVFDNLSINFLLSFNVPINILNLLKKNGVNRLVNLLSDSHKLLSDSSDFSSEEISQLKVAVDTSLQYLCKSPFDKLIDSSISDETILDDSQLVNMLSDKILISIKDNGEAIPLLRLKAKIGFINKRPVIFNLILRNLLHAKYVEFCAEGIRPYQISLSKFIDSIEKNQFKEILTHRLEGHTFDEIGQKLGVSRQYVFQCERRILERRPFLIEDKYSKYFIKYAFSTDDFIKIFSEDIRTYNYLKIAYNQGGETINKLRSEISLTDQQKKLLSQVLNDGYIILNGDKIKINFEEIKKYLIKTYAHEQISIKSFKNIYDKFISSYELDSQNNFHQLTENSIRNFISSNDYTLLSINSTFRYFDLSSFDAVQFFKEINLNQYKDQEISTLKLFSENESVMQDYGIDDEYELHSLLRKLKDRVSDYSIIRINRMPMISLGDGNINNQIVILLKNNAPISLKDFADLVEVEFGIKASSFLASGRYRSIIEPFLHEDTLRVDEVLLFSDLEVKEIIQLLPGEFYLLSELQIILSNYLQSNPDGMNKLNLKRLGFSLFGGYVVRLEGKSINDFFRDYILQKPIFSIEDNRNYLECSLFRTILYQMQKSLDIVEFMPRSYVTLSQLRIAGITKEDIESFQNDIDLLVDDGEIFTIDSLIQQKGLLEPFDKYGFDSYFAASLITYDNRFKSRKINNNILLAKGKETITIFDLILQLIGSIRKIDIFDLTDLLLEEYGVNISVEKIRFVIKESDIFYDDLSENIYATYSDYYEEF